MTVSTNYHGPLTFWNFHIDAGAAVQLPECMSTPDFVEFVARHLKTNPDDHVKKGTLTLNIKIANFQQYN